MNLPSGSLSLPLFQASPTNPAALSDIPPETWLTALTVTGVSLAVLLLVRWATPWLAKHAATTAGQVDDWLYQVLRHTHVVFLILLALFCGSLALPLPPQEAEWMRLAIVVAVLIQVGHWLNTTINFCFIWSTPPNATTPNATDRERAMSLQFVGFLGKVAVWTTVLLLVLSNLGVNVTALITGLGIGGVAVALAVQNLLGDLFASLALLLDKPFVVGDFVVAGETQGIVERIGLKTTRLRALQGEEIIVPNADLMKTRIQNFGRMQRRRVVFSFGLAYSTDADKIERVQKIVRTILGEIPQTQLDRAHLNAFGPAALEFEVVYHVMSADYRVHMDVRHKLYTELLRRLSAERIEIAALGALVPLKR